MPESQSNIEGEIGTTEAHGSRQTNTDGSQETPVQDKNQKRVWRIITPTKQIKKANKNDDTKLDEAFAILKESVAAPPPDACATYGAHVGNKLRNYNQLVRIQVEHKINNILYDADMGKYNVPNPYHHEVYNSGNNTDTDYINNPSSSTSVSSLVSSDVSNFQQTYDNRNGNPAFTSSPIDMPILNLTVL